MMNRILLAIFLIPGMCSLAQVPVNWNIDEVNPGNDITLFDDDEMFTEGTRSCRMQLNSGAVPYLISDHFNVVPGTPYDFSIDVLDNDTLGQLKVYCDFFDALGHNVFGEQPVFSADKAEWQTISWSGAVPPGAVAGYVLLKFYCQPELTTYINTARLWIDRCSFMTGPDQNLMVNGGFEDWAVGVDDDPQELREFRLYPNPATDRVCVKTLKEVDYIRIIDITGKTMSTQEVHSQEAALEIGAFPSGIYILQLVKDQAIIESLRFTKQ